MGPYLLPFAGAVPNSQGERRVGGLDAGLGRARRLPEGRTGFAAGPLESLPLGRAVPALHGRGQPGAAGRSSGGQPCSEPRRPRVQVTRKAGTTLVQGRCAGRGGLPRPHSSPQSREPGRPKESLLVLFRQHGLARAVGSQMCHTVSLSRDRLCSCGFWGKSTCLASFPRTR